MEHNAKLFLDDPPETFYELGSFQPYFQFDSFDVRRRLVPSSGLYEYKCRGVFPGVECKALVAVYLDFAYRTVWDPVLLDSAPLGQYSGQSTPLPDAYPVAHGGPVAQLFADDPCEQSVKEERRVDSAVETSFPSPVETRLKILKESHQIAVPYYYAIKMPFPLVTRDYVYTMRCWEEGDKRDVCIEGKSATHPAKPPQSKASAIRIDDYYQHIAVRQLDGQGTLLAMRYYDNPKGSIPPMIINFAAQKGVPSFVKGLTDAARKYPRWLDENF
jgi:hypothetical protein